MKGSERTPIDKVREMHLGEWGRALESDISEERFPSFGVTEEL